MADDELYIGDYRILRKLGSGGMATVYAACRGDEETPVALKVFAESCRNSRFLRERFVAEGRLLEKLHHPRLVPVYESGVDAATGRLYYAMACICDAHGHSTTLQDVSVQGEVTEERAERWYADLCAVIAYCHSQGVVHRDIKLGNVLLDADDHAVLSDFGVSRILEPELREELQIQTTFVTGETTATRPVMGTYWYLAPEVRKGAPATPASDWYALGVLFYRLLTGMWYEPDTDALDLLEPLAPIWRKRIAALVDDDPSKRPPIGESPEPTVNRRPRHRFFVFFLAALVLCGLGLAWWIQRGRPLSPPVLKTTSSPTSYSLAIDDTSRFDFCRCPPGTNTFDGVKYALPQQYWLGKTPVTRRQWFAVLDEPLTAWAGGEDAPITYVTRAEMTNFCAKLTARYASSLPRGYEIRLPTIGEWIWALVGGKTEPVGLTNKTDRILAYAERGWYGQEAKHTDPRYDGLRDYYGRKEGTPQFVKDIWPDFPPKVIRPGKDDWARRASRFPPAPVGLKRANDWGIYDMLGNCFERLLDECSLSQHHWGKTEWGVTTREIFSLPQVSFCNPLVQSGPFSVMAGSYLAFGNGGCRTWTADFDRLPHLGLRLCIGPKITP